MTGINNSISFQGNIRIKSFYKSFSGTYLEDIKTTKAQDAKIKNLVMDLIEKEHRLDTFPGFISKDKADRLYDLLSKIIGRPMRNVDNKKVIHFNNNHLSFGDYEAKWCGGETMSISLNA